MKVTLYSKKTNTTPVKTLSIYKAIESIKDGTYKEQVLKARNNVSNKEIYDKEKGKLPLIGWNGTFKTRGNANLTESSGFATLDFDKVNDLYSLIENVNKDPYTFCSFITPSGNGIKVLVKIPKVSNDEDYKSFYYELQNTYSEYAECDKANKDISRASFVSYDPNLYLNSDSELFTDRQVPKNIIQKNVQIKIDSEDEIVTRLLTWFKKKWRSGKDRNNHLFILASAFNDYGVSKSVALDYCLSYVDTDFRESEINSLVNSAYKKVENFNTKHFEDKNKITIIKNKVFSGVPVEKIKEQHTVSDEYLNELENEIPKDVFWEISEKGKIKISFFRFDRYLKSLGISKFYQDKKNGHFDFIIKDNNFINWIDTNRIKDLLKTNLINNGFIDVWDYMAANPKYFSRESLSMLDTIDVDYKKDTKEDSYLFFKNYAVRTTKDSIETIKYKDINSLIWKDQVIERDIVLSNESDGVFKRFIWLISGENKERYYTMKSVIGFLLHSYQSDDNAKVIIFNDEMLSDDIPNGGSGKGLIHKAISKLKNVVVEDGKRFDPKGQFAYQKVNKDTQILLLDDVNKNFNFEMLFSIVTDGLDVEKKGKDSFKIPFSDSPKFSITTNYTVKGDGPSFERRKFEVEIANYFNDKHTPVKEFGHLFFHSWDDKEWSKFDNFMIRCLQYFLNNGLVESEKVNLKLRKLRHNLGLEFIEFMESLNLDDYMVGRKEFRERFCNLNKNIAKYNTAQVFNKKVKDYCEYYDIELKTDHKYNGIIHFYFNKGKNKQKQEDDFPF